MEQESLLTEEEIRRWVGEMALRRGRAYRQQGRLVYLFVDGQTLRGAVQGNAAEPYRVWVRLRGGEIAAAQCTCPVGVGGHCKHTAAVLLAWLHSPGKFTPMPDIKGALQRLSHAELVSLVEKMVARHPDLTEMVVENQHRHQFPSSPEEPNE